MQKIAIPVLDQKLCPQFEICVSFVIFHVKDQVIVKEYTLNAPPHLSDSLPVWLANKGVTDVITREISHHEINLLNQHKINVFVGVKPESPEELVQEYIGGILETHDNLFA